MKVFIPKWVKPVTSRVCQATWGGRGTMAAAFAMICSGVSDGSTAMTGRAVGPVPSAGAGGAPAGPVAAPAGAWRRFPAAVVRRAGRGGRRRGARDQQSSAADHVSTSRGPAG